MTAAILKTQEDPCRMLEAGGLCSSKVRDESVQANRNSRAGSGRS